MLRSASLVLFAACAVDVVLAVPQAASTSSAICHGYMWGVTIEPLDDTPMPVYNQYVVTTTCAGPAWVQSSTEPTPPPSIAPWGATYDCQVPEVDEYYCDKSRVATCCGKSTAPAA